MIDNRLGVLNVGDEIFEESPSAVDPEDIVKIENMKFRDSSCAERKRTPKHTRPKVSAVS